MNSLYDYIKEYHKNKPLIQAYLKNQTIENYGDGDTNDSTILGLSIGIFITFLLIQIALWIWAIIVLVKYWKYLPDWAKVLGILGVLPIFFGGPILTLIVVYVGKK